MDGFADVILQAEEKGVTRARLAYLAGVDTRTISHWAEGRSEPKLAILRRLLVKGDAQVKAAFFAYLSRGTGWQSAPMPAESAEDRVRATAKLVKEVGDVAVAVAEGASQERLEAEVGDVVTQAAHVTAGKVRPNGAGLRIVGGGGL